MKRYRSSIPKAAKERVVATFITGPQKYRTNCTLNGKLVGVRYFHETGELSAERPLKNVLVQLDAGADWSLGYRARFVLKER